MLQNQSRYFPKGSIKARVKDTTIELGLYETRGKFFVVAYSGKRTKADFHYSFSKLVSRDKYLADYIASHKRTMEDKAQRQAARVAFRHSYKIGDIVYSSWGYEQTNVDFYQVTGTTEHTVKLRKIMQKTTSQESGAMSCYVVAVKDAFVKDAAELTKRPQGYDGGNSYIPIGHGHASLWDGRPKYSSWYH